MEVPIPTTPSRTVTACTVLVRRLTGRVRSARTGRYGAAFGNRGHTLGPVVFDSVAFSRLPARTVRTYVADVHEIDDAEELDQILDVYRFSLSRDDAVLVHVNGMPLVGVLGDDGPGWWPDGDGQDWQPLTPGTAVTSRRLHVLAMSEAQFHGMGAFVFE
jgi:hypothetical protein